MATWLLGCLGVVTFCSCSAAGCKQELSTRTAGCNGALDRSLTKVVHLFLSYSDHAEWENIPTSSGCSGLKPLDSKLNLLQTHPQPRTPTSFRFLDPSRVIVPVLREPRPVYFQAPSPMPQPRIRIISSIPTTIQLDGFPTLVTDDTLSSNRFNVDPRIPLKKVQPLFNCLSGLRSWEMSRLD